MRATNPEQISSKLTSDPSHPVPAELPLPWDTAGQNHLPPRGDISDLVYTGAPPKPSEGSSKGERLSNGLSRHDNEHDEEMEVGGASHEVGGASSEVGGAVNGERRELGEGMKRESGGSSSEDELRQSVGSVTSSEFNTSAFGGVREGGEMVEGDKWEGGQESSTDTTAHQVCT